MAGWRQWGAERRLVLRLRRTLADLRITGPTPMAEICRRLGEYRGRPIRLEPYPLPADGPFALWLAPEGANTADYILYQPETTDLHKEHLIAHELGHIVAGHRSDEGDPQVWEQWLPSWDADRWSGSLRRTHYDTAQEREAETLATILLETATTRAEVALPARSARAQRAQETLSDQGGWV